MRLSVRVSQRSFGGNASAGISRRPVPRKPIWLSDAQSPSAGGKRSKRFPEQNRTRSRLSRPMSSGRRSSPQPLTSRTSRVSARPKTSRGTSPMPSGKRSSRAPARSPRRSAASVSPSPSVIASHPTDGSAPQTLCRALPGGVGAHRSAAKASRRDPGSRARQAPAATLSPIAMRPPARGIRFMPKMIRPWAFLRNEASVRSGSVSGERSPVS